jgi:hypothetical protein
VRWPSAWLHGLGHGGRDRTLPPSEGTLVILLTLLLVAAVVTAVVYPFARALGDRRYRRGEPSWWSLKLHSGDREGALAEDHLHHEARQARRARRREALHRLLRRRRE